MGDSEAEIKSERPEAKVEATISGTGIHRGGSRSATLVDAEQAELQDSIKRYLKFTWIAFGISLITLAGGFGFAFAELLVPSIISMVALSIASISMVVFALKHNEVHAELRGLTRRERLNEELPKEATYFDHLVKINLDNLSAYYGLIKLQTGRSFTATLAIACFGAVLISVGLGLGFTRTDAAEKMTYIATGTGVLVEFIAGVFFWLYTKTVSELRGYHGSLLSVQNVLLAFKLVAETKDSQKADLVAMMCKFLLREGSSSRLEDLGSVDRGEPPIAKGTTA